MRSKAAGTPCGRRQAGILDHQILGLHNVDEASNEIIWDLLFLAFGVALIVGGWLLARSNKRRQSRA